MERLQREIQGIFAELTRYPIEILDPMADLEEDLGIDSVKLAEILAATRKKLGLPDSYEVGPGNLQTIAAITRTLLPVLEGRETPSSVTAPPEEANAGQARYPLSGGADDGDASEASPATRPDALGAAIASLRNSLAGSPGEAHLPRNGQKALSAAVSTDPGPLPATPPGPVTSPGTAPSATAGPAPAEDIGAAVLDIMAEVTRYPKEILTATANLEDDLGIDSVKRAEILTVVRQRLDLGQLEEGEMSAIQTVADVISATRRLLPTVLAAAPATNHSARPDLEAPGVAGGLRAAATSTRDSIEALTGRAPFMGKVALVTGSGHGIGKTIALYLSELGATVVVNSFHSRERGEATATEIRDQGGEAVHIWGSTAKEDHLRRIFAEIESRFGFLDFLICNASNGLIAPIGDIRGEHWERAFRTNVIGLHQGALLAAPLMARRGRGKIVTMSSPGARRYIEHFGCMGPVKAAVEALTRYLAIELAPRNIQVNAVSAGPVYGELLRHYPDNEKLVPFWEANTSNQRLSTARDVAHQVMYLLTDWADKVTGAVHMVDGGISHRI